MHHDALSMERFHRESQRDRSSDVDSLSFRNLPSSRADRASDDRCHACHAYSSHTPQREEETRETKSSPHENVFEWFDDQSETRSSCRDDSKDSLDLRAQLSVNDSILDAFSHDESTEVYRLLHAPGDILGHIDLLNGQKHRGTCRCITNCLVRRKSTCISLYRPLID